MSRILKSRRAKVLVGVMATMAVAAVAAFAYFSTTGTGQGSGDVTASVKVLGLTITQPAFDKFGSQTATVYATNSGDSAERIAGATVVVTSTATATCANGSFSVPVGGAVTLAPAFVTAHQEVPANTTTPMAIGTISVTLNDLTDTNQDGCINTGTAHYELSSN